MGRKESNQTKQIKLFSLCGRKLRSDTDMGSVQYEYDKGKAGPNLTFFSPVTTFVICFSASLVCLCC